MKSIRSLQNKNTFITTFVKFFANIGANIAKKCLVSPDRLQIT